MKTTELFVDEEIWDQFLIVTPPISTRQKIAERSRKFQRLKHVLEALSLFHRKRLLFAAEKTGIDPEELVALFSAQEPLNDQTAPALIKRYLEEHLIPDTPCAPCRYNFDPFLGCTNMRASSRKDYPNVELCFGFERKESYLEQLKNKKR